MPAAIPDENTSAASPPSSFASAVSEQRVGRRAFPGVLEISGQRERFIARERGREMDGRSHRSRCAVGIRGVNRDRLEFHGRPPPASGSGLRAS